MAVSDQALKIQLFISHDAGSELIARTIASWSFNDYIMAN
jgi:hypothetical protein